MGLGACPSPGKFEFRSSQIGSDAIWDKLSKQHFDDTYVLMSCNNIDSTTIITIINFKEVGGGVDSRSTSV